jgi:hypothetical protein
MNVIPFNSVNEVKKQPAQRVYHNNNKCASEVTSPKVSIEPGRPGIDSASTAKI